MLSIMKNKKLLCSVCFLFTFMSVLWGQNITVKGTLLQRLMVNQLLVLP